MRETTISLLKAFQRKVRYGAISKRETIQGLVCKCYNKIMIKIGVQNPKPNPSLPLLHELSLSLDLPLACGYYRPRALPPPAGAPPRHPSTTG